MLIQVEAEEVYEVSDLYNVASVPYLMFFKVGPRHQLWKSEHEAARSRANEGFGSLTYVVDLCSNGWLVLVRCCRVESTWTPWTVQTFPPYYTKVNALLGGATAEGGPTGQQLPADATGNQATDPTTASEDINSRLKKLLASAPVLLFMKGNKDQARCGFSRRVVEALNSTGIDFSTFDILEDEDVRQGLKEYSNWPTYPQLYVNGELMGGCDIIEEMHASGELKQYLEENLTSSQDINSRLKKLLASAPVLLFMKGNKDQARCGFSRRVVEALNSTGIDFSTFDILEDEAVRQGLKEYSNWPTYPQLYVNGELMGGCDIIEEMHASGELGSSIEAMMG